MGLIVAPIFGAVMVHIVGPEKIFITAGVIYFLILLAINSNLHIADKMMLSDVDSANFFSPRNQSDLSTLEFLKRPRFLFAALSQMNILGTLMFLQPTMAIFIKSHGFSDDMVALNMGLMALSYGLSAPFIYILSGYMEKRGIMFLG